MHWDCINFSPGSALFLEKRNSTYLVWPKSPFMIRIPGISSITIPNKFTELQPYHICHFFVLNFLMPLCLCLSSSLKHTFLLSFTACHLLPLLACSLASSSQLCFDPFIWKSYPALVPSVLYLYHRH